MVTLVIFPFEMSTHCVPAGFNRVIGAVVVALELYDIIMVFLSGSVGSRELNPIRMVL